MKILILLPLAFLGGCTLFSSQIDQAASAAGKLVKQYCDNTTPDIRNLTREKVNAAAAPHTVTVTCYGE